MLIGENEFDLAQHVVWAGRLEDLKTADVNPVPIERARIDLPTAISDAETVALKD